MNTFIQGISRVLNCPKVHVAATGLVTTYFAVRYVTGDLPPTQRASLWVAFIGAVAMQLREIINAWSEEDVAASQRDPTTNARDAPAAPDAASTVNPPITLSPTHPITLSSNDSTLERTTNMPARTKLPMILIAVTSIALLAATGCQSPPELTTYREGLHQIDEPLYQAHLLLMNDAINANIRTTADQQVVQQGIAAAEALYQQSKATSGTTVVATTQP